MVTGRILGAFVEAYGVIASDTRIIVCAIFRNGRDLIREFSVKTVQKNRELFKLATVPARIEVPADNHG